VIRGLLFCDIITHLKDCVTPSRPALSSGYFLEYTNPND
jgi:hypothetical protein